MLEALLSIEIPTRLSSPHEAVLIDPFNNPLSFAAAALEMANCNVGNAASELPAEGTDDFQFVFDIDLGLTLSLTYNASRDRYTISSSIAEQYIPAHIPELALQLNHLLPRSRRISRDPATRALVVSEMVARQGLAVDDLALTITDQTEFAIGLSRHQAGESANALLQENGAELIIRG